MRETPVDAVRMYSRGLIYPADKDTVLQVFQRNGATEDILHALREADKPRFVAPSDLTNVLWKAA